MLEAEAIDLQQKAAEFITQAEAFLRREGFLMEDR